MLVILALYASIVFVIKPVAVTRYNPTGTCVNDVFALNGLNKNVCPVVAFVVDTTDNI
jgi:hypothetical protein